jgi:hypothetical protein
MIGGERPAGGAYAEAFYDGDGRLIKIVEYDEGGIPLARTYAAEG